MVIIIYPDKKIRKRKRIEERKQEKENKRHKKFSSKIGNCQARPISEINLPISRIYERAIKFLLLLIIIMRKFFMLLSELRGYPNSILHIITVFYIRNYFLLLKRFSPNFKVQISNIDNYCSNFIVRYDSVHKILHISFTHTHIKKC